MRPRGSERERRRKFVRKDLFFSCKKKEDIWREFVDDLEFFLQELENLKEMTIQEVKVAVEDIVEDICFKIHTWRC